MLDFPVCVRLHLAEPCHVFVLALHSNPNVSVSRFVQCAGTCEFILNSKSTLNFGWTSILSPSLEVIKRHVTVVFGNMV